MLVTSSRTLGVVQDMSAVNHVLAVILTGPTQFVCQPSHAHTFRQAAPKYILHTVVNLHLAIPMYTSEQHSLSVL